MDAAVAASRMRGGCWQRCAPRGLHPTAECSTRLWGWLRTRGRWRWLRQWWQRWKLLPMGRRRALAALRPPCPKAWRWRPRSPPTVAPTRLCCRRRCGGATWPPRGSCTLVRGSGALSSAPPRWLTFCARCWRLRAWVAAAVARGRWGAAVFAAPPHRPRPRSPVGWFDRAVACCRPAACSGVAGAAVAAGASSALRRAPRLTSWCSSPAVPRHCGGICRASATPTSPARPPGAAPSAACVRR